MPSLRNAECVHFLVGLSAHGQLGNVWSKLRGTYGSWNPEYGLSAPLLAYTCTVNRFCFMGFPFTCYGVLGGPLKQSPLTCIKASSNLGSLLGNVYILCQGRE